MDNINQELFSQAADQIRNARSILITAGAGIGVDSGLPDFRGDEGFWNAYPPYRKLNLGFMDMANPEWFESNPRIAWGFYGHRLNLYRATIPHQGFNIMHKWALSKNDYFIFTSNVDGQFQKADFSEENIVECHGSIHHMQCSSPCNRSIVTNKNVMIEVDMDSMQATGSLPLCKSCGSLLRPNILMFGDWSFNGDRTYKQEEEYRTWLDRNKNQKLVIIEIGAGSGVPTVRMQSERIAEAYNATLIRINLREPKCYLNNSISISDTGLNALQQIDSLLRGQVFR